MNDIVLKKAVLKREFLFFCLALIVSLGLNVYAIIAYETPWSELVTSLGFVMIFAFLFYLIILVLRIVSKGIFRVAKSFK